MAIKSKKSKNFDTNLDGQRMVEQIFKNTREVGLVAGTNANAIAPQDSGDLRDEKKFKFVETGGGAKATNIWDSDYAKTRYESNKKNPQTTRWAEKDYSKNKSKYGAMKVSKRQKNNRSNEGIVAEGIRIVSGPTTESYE